MRSGRMIRLSFCLSIMGMHDYCKSNQPISLKPGVTIRPPIGKTDQLLVVIWSQIWTAEHFSTSLTIAKGDSSRFISISHVVISRFSQYSAK